MVVARDDETVGLAASNQALAGIVADILALYIYLFLGNSLNIVIATDEKGWTAE